MILYGSGMGNGNLHAADPIPLVIVGGTGMLEGDRHVVAKQHTPNANLLLSVADKFGVAIDKFGVSTARVEI